MPAPADLTPVEQALVDHVERGALLDLTDAKAKVVRAEVLRDILRGRLAPGPDPHGLQLRGARIKGRVDLGNVASSVALSLYDCLLDEGLDVHDAHLVALDLSGCELRHPTGPALDAEGLQTDRDVYLRGVKATGAGARGAVSLLNARMGGQLDANSARLRNDSGPALLAEHLRVDHGLFLGDGFEATGAGELGAVHLVDARVSHLSLSGATLGNDTGPALDADDLRVERSLHLREGFHAAGAGEVGAVRLLGAHVGGQLDGTGAKIRNDTGPALDLERAQVDRNVFLRDGFEAVGGGEEVALHLTDLRIGGALVFEPARLEHLADPQARLRVDGMTYGEPPIGPTPESWLRLLREGTPTYQPQPYQQLAAVLRAEGHDSEARRVLMRQRRDQLARGAVTSRGDRVWARLTGLTLGYGYQPWRALLALLGVIALSAVLAVVLGGHGALAQAEAACPVVDQVGVGLDLGTPLINTGSSARCQPTSSATGQALTLSGWVLRLLAWAFATLFVAGFTNAVRKA